MFARVVEQVTGYEQGISAAGDRRVHGPREACHALRRIVVFAYVHVRSVDES